jgi:signal transduction histidine kinase
MAKKIYAIGPEIEWTYITSASGQIIMYPGLPDIPNGYDPRSRRWYINSLKTGDITWTRPYFAAGGSDLVVTVSRKIDNVTPLSDAVVAIDINLQSLMSNRLSFSYCDKCRLMLADENCNVIAERDMAKKGDWKNAPAPIKLGSVFSAMFKGEDSHRLTEQLYKKDARTSLVKGNAYIFSLPVGFLDWRLVGVIPTDYYGADGSSIIGNLESIILSTKRELLLVLFSVSVLSLLSLVLFLALSKRTIQNRLVPLLHEFVELSKLLKGGREYAVPLKNGGAQDRAGLSSEYDDILSAIIAYEKEITAQSRLAAISETATQVAHDIRSPLAALGAAAKRLDLHVDQRALIDGAVERMQGIADDLLRRYRAPEAAHAASKPAVHAMGGLIGQVLAEKRLQHKEKTGVKIVFNNTAGEVKALVEPKELQRLISNLVNNSVEAFKKDGLVTVSLSAPDGKVFIEVKDDGKGIPPEILAKLGQKGETRDKANGNGLGLYHARTTVESWGGSFRMESAPGKGTAVTIELPRVGEKASIRLAVLLDDDPLVHMNGKLAAKAAGAELKAFKTPEDFAADIAALPKDTAIYIDSELGNGVKGEDIANDLHAKGFSDLSMATGHGPENFAHLPWLKVTGKEPPWG